ncbi:DUF1480 family protein [Erwinia sp. E602]|uniref:DUF1480 family protein n=1 Tax=Erwinia sp. E602 TaxID=2675378 RepID=UPI001BAD766E|nr:DUF1480 family protein [Erwinia sp. E602]QUG75935.1 DUF1480 family protein [Erwinia sp. E602]
MGNIVKIGRYDVVDAELDGQHFSTVSIPCHTNPGLCVQLDGWDAQTSVPAIVDGKSVDLALGHYDTSSDRWILNKPA